MGVYAVVADVAARLSGRVIDATTSPSDTNVSDWIDQTEALVIGELKAAGFAIGTLAGEPAEILKDKIVVRVVGITERAYSSGTDFEGDVGSDLIEEFEEFLILIRNDPARIALMLDLSNATSTSTSSFKAYVTENDDSKTIEGGDFAPTLTRDMTSRTSSNRW